MTSSILKDYGLTCTQDLFLSLYVDFAKSQCPTKATRSFSPRKKMLSMNFSESAPWFALNLMNESRATFLRNIHNPRSNGPLLAVLRHTLSRSG